MKREIIKKKIGEVQYEFIVSTAMSSGDKSVNVNVQIDINKDKFKNLSNKSAIFKGIATDVATSINSNASLRLTPISTGDEWQGQFDFY